MLGEVVVIEVAPVFNIGGESIIYQVLQAQNCNKAGPEVILVSCAVWQYLSCNRKLEDKLFRRKG
jgi:hypothetical protein